MTGDELLARVRGTLQDVNGLLDTFVDVDDQAFEHVDEADVVLHVIRAQGEIQKAERLLVSATVRRQLEARRA